NDPATGAAVNPPPAARPKKPHPKPEPGKDFGDMQLNVPELPNKPQQTTTNKPPIEGGFEIEPSTPPPALTPPTLDLQPETAPPMLSPPGKTPKPKLPANDTLPADPLNPEPELTIPPVEPVKPEMKNEVKPELPATEPVKPEPAPPKTDD